MKLKGIPSPRPEHSKPLLLDRNFFAPDGAEVRSYTYVGPSQANTGVCRGDILIVSPNDPPSAGDIILEDTQYGPILTRYTPSFFRLVAVNGKILPSARDPNLTFPASWLGTLRHIIRQMKEV